MIMNFMFQTLDFLFLDSRFKDVDSVGEYKLTGSIFEIVVMDFIQLT